jgi:hypothetical protein
MLAGGQRVRHRLSHLNLTRTLGTAECVDRDGQ